MAPKRVAGYFRVSKARDDMAAVDVYRQEIERYCSYKGLELADVFSDIDFSGYRGAPPRPALEDLLRCRHDFSAVVVPKLSRFGRSVKDLVELFELFDRDGISLVFLDMNIDTNTSQGRLLRHIMAAFAEYESDVKSDYGRANHRHVRSLGRPWGGRPPFGYELHPAERSYVVNEGCAAIVRHIFDRYRAGASQYELARELNRRGMLRPSGSPWRSQQVGRILDNPAYVARCIVDESFVPAVWEAIIDSSTWDQIRKIRAGDKRRNRQLRMAKGGPYLLSGLLHCGHCGRKLHHRSKKETANGIYLCEQPGGKRCPGGSVDCLLADAYVMQQFLDRCYFALAGDPQPTYSEGERRWNSASMLERRRLLLLAIRAIVLVPWPGGDTPQRTPGRRRELKVSWAHGANDGKALVVIADRGVQPERPRVSEGRSDMLRGVEAEAIAEARRARSERSRSYHEEWRRFRESNARSKSQ
jgi:DNA invertase Pin-like site-specific DNA recombinase